MPGLRIRIAFVAFAIGWALPALAEPVVTGTGGAGDPIVIVLDGPVAGQLAVEVDGVDMTDLIARNGNILSIQPVPPLPGGAHEVILYSVAADSFDIVIEWQIEGGRAPLVDSVSVLATHEAGVVTGNAGTETHAESSGELEIIMLDQRLKAGAQYLATTVEDNEYDGRPVNLGEYYLEFTQPTDSMDITARLGHQTVDYDDLVVSNLYKRGAGMSFERLDQRFVLGFFGTQSADGIGIDNFTGLEDGDDRMFGASVALQPFGGTDLTFALTAYSGRGEQFDGFGIGEGEAYSLAISGSARDGRLRYGLGAAMSTFALDGGTGPEDGNAYRASLDYDVISDDGFDGARTLTFGLAYERVDFNYLSLASPELLSSHETVSLTADYLTDTTTLSAYADHQITGINSPDTEAVERIISTGVFATRSLWADGNGPRWAGFDPLISVNLEFATQDRVETPALAPGPLDATTLYGSADFSTSYENWGWSLGYAFDWFNDETPFNEDSFRHGLIFGIDHTPTQRLSYGINGNVDTVSDFGGNYVEGSIGLNASYDIMPGELVLTGDYQMDFSTVDFGFNGGVLGADLTWAFSEAADLEFSVGLAHGDQAVVDPVDWSVGALLRFKTNYIR